MTRRPSRPTRPRSHPGSARRSAASSSPSAGQDLRFRASEPEDLVAVSVVMLGFAPEESLVMLTFGRGPCFHARVDLPPPDASPAAITGLMESLLAPAVKHRIEQVAFVFWCDEPARTGPLAHRLVEEFGAVGIEVVAQVRQSDGRVFPPGAHAADGMVGSPLEVGWEGRVSDPWSHPFLAEFVLAGHVVAGSRRDVEASVAPDPARVLAVRAAWSDRGAPVVDPAAVDVVEQVRVLAARGDVLSAREMADLLDVLHVPAQYVRAWCPRSRREARAHADLWAGVVRATPPGWVAAPAGLLALAAAHAGDGALAWCAVDRAQDDQPGDALTSLVASLLMSATHPDAYAPPRLDGGLDAGHDTGHDTGLEAG